MRDVKVSLVGYGIVGHGVVDVLSRKKAMLRDMGLNLRLVSVTDHTGTVLAEDGVDASKILGERTLENVATSGIKGKEAVSAIDSELVIEVTPTNIVHGQPGLGTWRRHCPAASMLSLPTKVHWWSPTATSRSWPRTTV